MSDERPRIPDLLLERYRLGEVSAAERQRVAATLASDPELRARLRGLDDSDRLLQRQHPPQWLAAQVRQRLAAREPSPRRDSRAAERAWLRPAALASAAVLLLVVATRTAHTPAVQPVGEATEAPAPATSPGTDRIKGLAPSLALYRRTAQGSEPLADGARARRGDVIRLAYRAAGAAYGAILSVDGRGTVTVHLPGAGTRAVPLGSGEVRLDHAYELDDAPRSERFYLITSPAPFDLAPALAAARAAVSPAGTAPRLALPEGLEQSTFLVEKEETR